MLRRTLHFYRVKDLLAQFPVVAILGARQVGKTTLAGQIKNSWKQPTYTFDLESPTDLVRLADPELALAPLKGLVILDEIQRLPNLFPLLRVLADRRPIRTRFLILGSASPQMLRQGNEDCDCVPQDSRVFTRTFCSPSHEQPRSKEKSKLIDNDSFRASNAALGHNRSVLPMTSTRSLS